jgi:hypothetical protein
MVEQGNARAAFDIDDSGGTDEHMAVAPWIPRRCSAVTRIGR